MKLTKTNNLKNVFNKQHFNNKEKSFWTFLPEIFLIVIFSLSLTIAVLFFSAHKYYQVNQFSMQPLLNNYKDESLRDGVFVLVDCQIEIGDVFVLDHNGTTIIKRLIAKGGDRVAIVERDLSWGKEYAVQRISKGSNVPYTLVEPYISSVMGMQTAHKDFETYLETTDKKEIINGVTYLVLDEDEIFYLGDNRGKSYDSSIYGPGKLDDIIGKVQIIVWKEQNVFFHILQYVLGFRKV